MNNMDLKREDIIKVAGNKLGINTAGTLLDPRFDYVFKYIIPISEKVALSRRNSYSE